VVLLRGKSGSGKSCLLQTLAGELAALGGQMLLNGQPVDALTDSQRCQLAGYLPQRPYLFGLSIAAELRLARANATDDELLAVLALVELSDWLAHQPQGLRTVLADDGVGLSGGELKRFALARLLLLKPPLLLLDEPFAGLHSALAERLLARLTAFQRGGILLIASHQLQQSACFSQCWDLSQPEPAARAGAEDAM
jgi:ATP-binding cassette subfamily C protein CydC